MPIFVYHGSGLTAISNAISKIKATFPPEAISEINGKNSSIDQAIMNVSTPGLFAEKRLLILENYTEKVDVSDLKDDSSTTVVFRFNKQLPATSVFLKSVKKLPSQIQEFSEADEISIFPFLDLLGEKKSAAFGQFEKVYAEYGGQYILTMLYYFYRRTIVIPKKTPSFALQKLERQKRNFPLQKLTELYSYTLETDFKIKSGFVEDKLGLTMVVEKILTI